VVLHQQKLLPLLLQQKHKVSQFIAKVEALLDALESNKIVWMGVW
jgi:hypothetical protein